VELRASELAMILDGLMFRTEACAALTSDE